MSRDGAGETYSISDATAQETYVGTRRAREWVPFFLPHLRPGMSLLDCGCGVGSITLDLVELLAPGSVVGVDIDGGQLAVARAEAARRGLTNVRFEEASLSALPFPAASFDAVLAHTLIFHLRDPLAAIRALRGVLKPGGMACVSDDDYVTLLTSPADSAATRAMELWTRVLVHNGANPYYARHLRGLFLQAGFARVEGHAIAAGYHGTPAATSKMAGIGSTLLDNPAVSAVIIGEGWADA